MKRAAIVCMLLALCKSQVYGSNVKDGSGWIEIRTPHFTVLTDGPVDRAIAVGDQLECSQSLLSSRIDRSDGIERHATRPLVVLAFRRGSELQSVAPLWKTKGVQLSGLFQAGEGTSFIGVNLEASSLRHVVAHEFSHALLDVAGERYPVWLQEGLSEFLADVAESNHRPITRDVFQNNEITLVQLFSVREDSREYKEAGFRQAFYAAASLTAEYLWTNAEQKQRLFAYLELTRAGLPTEAAIQQAFHVSSAELTRAIRAFAAKRLSGPRSRGENECPRMQSKMTPISDLDARAHIAEFKAQVADHRDEAIRELQAILEQDPTHKIAIRGLAYALWSRGDAVGASEYFRLAASADPTDSNLQYLSAVLLKWRGADHDADLRRQMQSALLKTIALSPEFADAYHWLSLTYAWDGDYGAASVAALKAVELDPISEGFKFNLAAFYAHARRSEEAYAVCNEYRNASDEGVLSRARSRCPNRSNWRDNQPSARRPGPPPPPFSADTFHADTFAFQGFLNAVH